VVRLFPQLGRDTFRLPAALAAATELGDVAGVTLSCLTLRARRTKAGWSHGENDDGARFTTYVRRFPGAGLVAVLRFSGTELPERDVEAPLESLLFHRPGAGPVPLGEVPPVLLAECNRDVHALNGPRRMPLDILVTVEGSRQFDIGAASGGAGRPPRGPWGGRPMPVR